MLNAEREGWFTSTAVIFTFGVSAGKSKVIITKQKHLTESKKLSLNGWRTQAVLGGSKVINGVQLPLTIICETVSWLKRLWALFRRNYSLWWQREAHWCSQGKLRCSPPWIAERFGLVFDLRKALFLHSQWLRSKLLCASAFTMWKAHIRASTVTFSSRIFINAYLHCSQRFIETVLRLNLIVESRVVST